MTDCGSGDGSGDCDNTVGSGLQSGSGFDENGRGLDGSGRGLQSGSGFDESGSGQREGSGSPPSPELEGVVAVVWKNNGGGSGGWLEGTAGQSDRLDTLLDDEDMAYGQALRRRRKNYRRDLKTWSVFNMNFFMSNLNLFLGYNTSFFFFFTVKLLILYHFGTKHFYTLTAFLTACFRNELTIIVFNPYLTGSLPYRYPEKAVIYLIYHLPSTPPSLPPSLPSSLSQSLATQPTLISLDFN